MLCAGVTFVSIDLQKESCEGNGMAGASPAMTSGLMLPDRQISNPAVSPLGAAASSDLEIDLALSPNIRGSLFMSAAMAGFTMNDAITKAVSSEMNFGQIMMVRGLLAIVLIAALAWHRDALRPLRTVMMKPVALRVVGEIVGTISFMAAIVHLPMANTAAIFQALPLAITFGAALIFSEPVGWRRWSAIAAGFVGVLIVVRP